MISKPEAAFYSTTPVLRVPPYSTEPPFKRDRRLQSACLISRNMYHETCRLNRTSLLPIALNAATFALFQAIPARFCNCIDRQVCSERPRGASEKEAPPEPWLRVLYLEGKHRTELIAPVVGLTNVFTRKEQVVWFEASGRLVIGGVGDNVTTLVHKRDPLVQTVGQRSGVEVGAPKVIAVLRVRVFGTVGAILHVQ